MRQSDGKSLTTRYATMRVRMVRPGYIGIQISAMEYVMAVSEANELIAMINRAKHDGVTDGRTTDDPKSHC